VSPPSSYGVHPRKGLVQSNCFTLPCAHSKRGVGIRKSSSLMRALVGRKIEGRTSAEKGKGGQKKKVKGKTVDDRPDETHANQDHSLELVSEGDRGRGRGGPPRGQAPGRNSTPPSRKGEGGWSDGFFPHLIGRGGMKRVTDLYVSF